MVIFSLFVSMALTLFLVSKKLNIGYSLIAGAVLLAILTGKGFVYISKLLFGSLIESTTISLGVTIALITILGHLMEKYLILDRMIIALEKMLRSAKATLLVSPAIIGTLLVTGGALMSCPVVDSLGSRLNISHDKKAAINMVFRHALYFIFPFSPTIVLAAELGNYSVWDFVKLQAPIAISMWVVGYIMYLRGYKEEKLEKVDLKQYLYSISEFLLYSSPILISLLGVVIFKLPFHISLIAGIALSIVINIFDRAKDTKYNTNESIFKTLYKGIKPSMIIAVIGIMVFKNAVNDIDEIFIQLNNLLDSGMPLELLIFIAAALISFPLASTQPGIAILYPMILPLAPSYDVKLLYAMFIYTNSFLFYYISPLHLCQVLTIDYFKVTIKELFKNYTIVLPVSYLIMVVVYVMNMFYL